MAAFSYQELPFVVDCVLTPDMMMKLSSSASSSTITSPLLSPSCCFPGDPQSHLLNSDSNYPDPIFQGEELQYQFGNFVNFHQEQFKPIGFSLHESSCVEQVIAQSIPASSDNETSVTPKQSTLNVGAAAGGAQNRTPVDNKRKVKRHGSSPNPSKGLRGGRSKKQKKSNNEGVKKEEGEEEEERKKTPSPSPSPSAAEEAPKGYIHVRARRGQATDSHSLAERARREKISERMKLLQALVPGCDKVTGKATMLDEIINYVRSLQTQVEFLSMKLSSLNPMVYSFGLDLDSLLLGQQALNKAAPPVGLVQQCNQSTTKTAPAGVANAATTTGMPTLFQQQVQRGSIPLCAEDNFIGSVYWGSGGGPDPVYQPGICINSDNNMMLMY